MGIVKFKSKAAGDIVMFQNDAENLCRIMGMELGTRGVIESKDLDHAHAQLLAAINKESMASTQQPENESDSSSEDALPQSEQVGLEQRAYPLLKMLEKARKQQVDVHWGF